MAEKTESRTNGSAEQAVNVRHALALMSELGERLGFAGTAGISFEGKRDLYKALGYPRNLTFKDFYSVYKRQDIATRIIEIKPNATWKYSPEITEIGSGNEDTEFETRWKEIAKKNRVFYYLHKADILSRIGCYGCIYLGLDDNKPSEEPAEKASDLIYMQCFHQGAVKIKVYDTKENSPRYGYPDTYQIEFRMDSGKSVKKIVHHTRIIHIAENSREGDIEGTPELEAVFNRLMDLEKIAGGAGEMFWRGARPNLAFEAEPGAKIENPEALEKDFEELVHGLKTYIALEGIKTNQLAPQVADPEKHWLINIQSICTKIEVPQRILLGSERGELASTQDERNWLGYVEQRRINHAEPNILRPFIDRLIKLGVLPEPKKGYSVYWQPLLVLGESDKATIAQTRTTALTSYANSLDAPQIVPPAIFLEEIMGFDRDTINRIDEMLGGLLDDERDTSTQS